MLLVLLRAWFVRTLGCAKVFDEIGWNHSLLKQAQKQNENDGKRKTEDKRPPDLKAVVNREGD